METLSKRDQLKEQHKDLMKQYKILQKEANRLDFMKQIKNKKIKAVRRYYNQYNYCVDKEEYFEENIQFLLNQASPKKFHELSMTELEAITTSLEEMESKFIQTRTEMKAIVARANPIMQEINSLGTDIKFRTHKPRRG